jgi:hypothetical protein
MRVRLGAVVGSGGELIAGSAFATLMSKPDETADNCVVAVKVGWLAGAGAHT